MEHMKIEWTEDLRTGLLWQDYQHQELFRNIAALRDGILKKAHTLEKTKEFLEFYTVAHFSVEETYMKTFNYSDMESHLKEHTLFKKRLNQLYPSASDFISTISLCNDAYEWIQNHVLTVDKKFASFIKDSIGKELKI